MKKTPRVGAVRVFDPVLIDACSEGGPEPGEKVRVVQPYGCPRNGTMGFVYVETLDGEHTTLRGEPYFRPRVGPVLVHVNSLAKEQA